MSPVNRIHIIDLDYRRRSTLASLAISHGWHAEIHDSIEEFNQFAPTEGAVLLHDDPERRSVERYFVEAEQSRRLLPTGVYSTEPRPRQIIDAGISGAVDYFTFPPDRQTYAQTLERLTNSVPTMRSASASRLAAKARIDRLSNREAQVLREMSTGMTNREIGQALGISPRTVEIHRANLLRKLGVRTTAECIRIELEAGGVTPTVWHS